jgi:hypothetical protein
MAAPALAPAAAAGGGAAAGGSAAAGAGAGSAAASAAASLLNDFIAALAGAGIASAMNPPAIPSAGTDSSGKYFISEETDLRLIPDYRADLFRTRLLNSLGFDLPLPRAPQDILGDIEARRTRQAESLTEREIEKLRADRAFDVALEKLIQDAAVRQAQIESTGRLRQQEVASAADVRGRELEGLAKTQAERLRGSYGMASNVLQNTIENVLRSGVINDRTAQVELAKIK